MTREIITYQAPAQLLRSDSIFRQQYSDCLHIVATSSLKSGIAESLRDYRWFDAPLVTFGDLFSELAGEIWSSPKAQLRQFLQLSDIFTGLWEQLEAKDLYILQSLERNQLQVLKTIRTMMELGITPDELASFKRQGKLTSTEKLLLIIWKRVFKAFLSDSRQLRQFQNEGSPANALNLAVFRWVNEITKNHKKDRDKEKEDKVRRIKENLRRSSNLLEKDWQDSITRSLKEKKLILHGFYFITPIQELVFRRLEEDYTLVFLNTYDSRFPHTFETVNTFLGTEVNKTTNVVPDDVGIHPLAAKLIERFEGKSDIKVEQKVTVYSDLAHFVETEKNLHGQNDSNFYHLLTPRAEEVEKQLIANQFVPDSKKKLTDYPVGRFLLRLHQMKGHENNLDTGEVTFSEQVTPNSLLDIFSSGCLIVNGVNMRAYVMPLEKILPYFKNITTFEGWYRNIRKLNALKKDFETNIANTNPKALSDRKHRFHSMPIRQLSYFSVEQADLDKILLGIRYLERIHSALFSNYETKKVDISTHLKALEEYVLKDLKSFLIDSEREIVENLIDEIAELHDDELEFSLKDISQGLLFYLDGTLQEAANPSTTADQLFAFDSADGAPFRTNRKFHLAFADHKSLPISQGFTLWPISREVLKFMELRHNELELLEERKRHSNSITRYLLYVLFHSADDVRFSFVKHLGKESRLELALYLKLLGCEVIPAKREWKTIETEFKKSVPNVSIEKKGWTLSMEREAKVCGKRGAFSFILNEHPSFKRDFHHGFLYQNYLMVLEKVANIGKTDEEVRKLVDSWFPQWNQTKLNFNYDYVMKKFPFGRGISTIPVNLDKVNYSQGISYLHLLPNSYGSRKSADLKNEEVVLHEANPGEHCQYCPYQSICRDAMYPIDVEDEKTKTKTITKTKTADKLDDEKIDPKKKNKTIKANHISPKKQSEFSLLNYLESKGLEIVDKREKKGCLWIIGGKELQPIIKDLGSKNIKFTFSQNGSRSTRRKPGWYSNYPD